MTLAYHNYKKTPLNPNGSKICISNANYLAFAAVRVKTRTTFVALSDYKSEHKWLRIVFVIFDIKIYLCERINVGNKEMFSRTEMAIEKRKQITRPNPPWESKQFRKRTQLPRA